MAVLQVLPLEQQQQQQHLPWQQRVGTQVALLLLCSGLARCLPAAGCAGPLRGRWPAGQAGTCMGAGQSGGEEAEGVTHNSSSRTGRTGLRDRQSHNALNRPRIWVHSLDTAYAYVNRHDGVCCLRVGAGSDVRMPDRGEGVWAGRQAVGGGGWHTGTIHCQWDLMAVTALAHDASRQLSPTHEAAGKRACVT